MLEIEAMREPAPKALVAQTPRLVMPVDRNRRVRNTIRRVEQIQALCKAYEQRRL